MNQVATEKKFLAKAMKDLLIKRYLDLELRNAGVSTITIQKTPLATRIAIHVKKPSMVIGKRGATVKIITEKLEKDFGIDNPQLDIIEVENPNLDAKLVAGKIARQIEIEGNIKQIMRVNLKDVKEAGAIGVEIIVSGKVVGKGGKAKAIRVRSGYLKKSGDLLKLIDMGKATAYLKAGAIGVTAKIVHPDTVFPDAINIDYDWVSSQTKEGQAAQEKIEEAQSAKVVEVKNEVKKVEKKKKPSQPRPAKKKVAGYEAENLIKSAEGHAAIALPKDESGVPLQVA